MRNLGLTPDSQSDTDTFDKYVKLFNEGLTKSQVQFIKELFMAAVPVQDLEAVDLEE
jgi:hypothetical protein